MWLVVVGGAGLVQGLHWGPGLDDAVLGEVARAAQQLWTSDERLAGGEGVPAAHRRELCAMLNAALRADDPALLAAALPLIRAIDSLRVVYGVRPEARLRFPPVYRSFRGGGLPDAQRGFFAVRVEYRVPGSLATSFDREARHPPGPPALTPADPPPDGVAMAAFGRGRHQLG
jgi:hypothetical protein